MRRVWRDDKGERHWIRGKDEQEIADKIAELKYQLKNGSVIIDGKMTVQDWAEKWLKDYIDPKVRPAGAPKKRGTMTQKSADMYRQMIRNHIIPEIGFARLCDIKDVHLQRLLNSQRDKSDSHVKKLRIVLEAVFKQAYKSRIIPFNPAEDLTLPAAEAGKRRKLTDYERSVILQVAKTHRCGLWIRFLLGTGIRPGESAPLQVRDLDLKADPPRVKIYKAIEAGTENVISSPKTEAGFRDIPLPDDLLPDLRRLAAGKDALAYLFPQKDGKTMMTSTSISKCWISFSRQVDLAMGAETTPKGHIYDPKDILPNGKPIYPDPKDKSQPRNGHKIAPDLTLYCLRHTYCTDLQQKGVPLNVARYLMGHQDISTTANIYTHSGEEEVILASSIINAKPQKADRKTAE